jgi:hypothetical protein
LRIRGGKSFNGKPQASATLPAKSQKAGTYGLPLKDRAMYVVRPPTTNP